MSRDVAKQMVRQAGGKVVSSVSSNLDFLVLGDSPGSKFKKAQGIKSIKILHEKEFLNLIKK